MAYNGSLLLYDSLLLPIDQYGFHSTLWLLMAIYGSLRIPVAPFESLWLPIDSLDSLLLLLVGYGSLYHIGPITLASVAFSRSFYTINLVHYFQIMHYLYWLRLKSSKMFF